MTVEELRNHFNDQYGVGRPFPETYIVDAETYANVCQFTFIAKSIEFNGEHLVKVHLGKNNGIMFKGVELILKNEKND